MAMSMKKRREEEIAKLTARVSEYNEVREAAAKMIDALKLDPPKKVKAKKAYEALEATLLATCRCGCGRHASYNASIRGGVCETCMST